MALSLRRARLTSRDSRLSVVANQVSVLLLAATNGANDNFKGVATLYGSRTVGYWTSLGWASITTLAGSLGSVYLAQGLLKAFTGAGLVPADIAAQTSFALAVAGGAAITVALASWRGMPISTTHALVGAMSGAGLVAAGMDAHFGSLGRSFLLPLLASPLIAVIPAFLSAPLLRRLVVRAERKRIDCLCIAQGTITTPDGLMMRETAVLRTGSTTECGGSDTRTLMRFDATRQIDTLHFLLAGAVGFARGLNDTPKIAALLLPIAMLDSHAAVLAVAIAMLLGGLLGARRVARTMSEKITDLDLGASLAASLTTSLLVSTASFNGLPVSTTHVAVGALAGAGASGRSGVNRRVITDIALSWVVTLPVGALFGAILYAWVR
ncbi:inorganic phosphate transporter [Rhodanobacter sp. OR87]|uniref:inorganic phosphate transporter n=1 Tax=Rhodanobacter sp. OR87 TaxID=1076523 RepID=UPI001E54DE0E|nr:inorganic phosphate transporter [Rhodanobacter sp. OR87]